MTSPTCPKCGTATGEGFRFCPKCGARLHSLPFAWKHLAIAIVAAIPFTFLMLKLQGALAGSRPTTPRAEFAAKSYSDPTLERLRAATKSDPENLGHWRALGEALGEKYTGSEAPPKELTFEVIHVLGEILKRAPEDGQALITMANVSFNAQAFDKAADYYERYLKIAPADDESRIHYASALTFLSRFDDAEKELGTVLAHDPKNFQAQGLLALNFAARGDSAKAEAAGKKALELAPTEEAKNRMQEFLAKVAGTEPESTGPAVESPRGTGLAGMRARLAGHSILGPKLRDVEERGEELRILVKDFPMAAMPPFAKEKFFTTIRGYLAETKLTLVKRVLFIDEASGQTLETMQVSGG